MKRLKSSAFAKTLAFILCLLFAAGMFMSFMCVGVLYGYGGYTGGSLNTVLRNYLEPWCVDKMYNNMEGYRYGADPEELDSTVGMTFTIYDQNGKLVYDGLGSQSYMLETSPYGFWYPAEDSAAYNAWMWEEEASREGISPEPSVSPDTQTAVPQAGDALSSSQPTAEPSAAPNQEPQSTAFPDGEDSGLSGSMSSPEPTEAAQAPEPDTGTAATGDAQTQEPTAGPEPAEDSNQSAYVEAATARYSMVGYVLETVGENDEVAGMTNLLTYCYAYRNLLLGAMIGFALLALCCFAFLMAAAGHKSGIDEIQPGLTERLPFDVFTAAAAALGVILMGLLIEFSSGGANILKFITYTLVFEAGAALCLW